MLKFRLLLPVLGAFLAIGPLALPASADAANVEQTFRGILEVILADGEDGTSRTFYALHDGDARYPFHRSGALGEPLVGAGAELVSGVVVEVRGVLVGEEIVLAAVDDGTDLLFPTSAAPQSLTASPLLAGATAAPELHSTLVILGDFTDVSLACTTTDVDAFMFTNPDSAAANYGEASFGQVAFEGDVIGPFAISYASTGASYLSWASALATEAQNAGYTLTDYLHIVYVLPPNGTGYTGLGTTGIGGLGYGSAWIFRCDRPGLYAHETGHNFTMSHASRYFIDTAIVWTYGDQTCPMGSQLDVRHYNAPHKYKAGWIPEESVTTVTNDGLYLLHRLEDENASGVHVLRIANPEPHIGSSDTYWVSYRTGWGLDANLSATYQNKVFIHEASATPSTTYLRTWLDTGETFAEPAGSISPVQIQVIEQDGTVASVLVAGVSPPLDMPALPTPALWIVSLLLVLAGRYPAIWLWNSARSK